MFVINELAMLREWEQMLRCLLAKLREVKKSSNAKSSFGYLLSFYIYATT